VSGVANFSAYIAGFNRAADELGVAGVPSFAALLLGDLTLLTDVPALLGISAPDVEAWRPSDRYRPETRIRYAGPIYARLPLALPERVERFLASPGPVVYVAITSTGPELVRQAAGAARRTGARVIVAGTSAGTSGLPQFVAVRGGEYCFMPGLRALKWMAGLEAPAPKGARESRVNASTSTSARAAATNAAMLMMPWRNADAKSPCDDASWL